MENSDIDLVGQTFGNMFYKIGIVDKDGKLTNQFVAKASTNRVDIPESALGTPQSQVPQISSTTNLFSGSAVGNIKLVGPSANYDNVQDGLLITLSDKTSGVKDNYQNNNRMDLSSLGLTAIKIPKEKLVVNSSFDISDQLSQYIGKPVTGQDTYRGQWGDFGKPFIIVSFGGTTIKVLPNMTLSMNLTVSVKGTMEDSSNHYDPFPIPVIQVNTYKN